MGVHEIKSTQEFKQILEKGGAVVADFFAEWCGPCKLIAPKLASISDQTPNVDFVKVDVDKLGELAAEFGISAMPTIVFFKGGERVHTVVGADLSAISNGVQQVSSGQLATA